MAVVSSDKDGVVHAGLLDLVPSRSGTVYKRWLDPRGPFKKQLQVAILDSFQGAAKVARIGPGCPHTVFQATPRWRAIPNSDACSPASWSIAHRHARVVNSPRRQPTRRCAR